MKNALLLVLIAFPLLCSAGSELQPFLDQAKEKYAEGEYNASRDLCEELLKREPRMEQAKEMLTKSKRQLQRLAKEAYLYGVEAERNTQLEMATSYWNRAWQYVRPGDPLHREISSKLEKYR